MRNSMRDVTIYLLDGEKKMYHASNFKEIGHTKKEVHIHRSEEANALEGNHDNASHTLNPMKNTPNETNDPIYTTVCTPALGSTKCECKSDSTICKMVTTGTPIVSTWFDFLKVAGSSWIVDQGHADEMKVSREGIDGESEVMTYSAKYSSDESTSGPVFIEYHDMEEIVDRRYAEERIRVTPSENRRALARCKQDIKAGIRW